MVIFIDLSFLRLLLMNGLICIVLEVRNLWKRRNTKSNINREIFATTAQVLASMLCTNVMINGKYKYLYQNIRSKNRTVKKIIDSYGLALDGRVVVPLVVLSCLVYIAYNLFWSNKANELAVECLRSSYHACSKTGSLEGNNAQALRKVWCVLLFLLVLYA